MLYDSTKTLLQSILRSLETSGEIRWDEHTESGNACLYEMHQMSRPLYKAYRTDKQNANSQAQIGFPEKLSRAMPHVRSMVIAIRHKDQTTAVESGKSALAPPICRRNSKSRRSPGRSSPAAMWPIYSFISATFPALCVPL